MKRRDVFVLGGLWTVLTALAEGALLVARAGYPASASPEGAVADEALFVLLRLAIPVFVLVALLLVYLPLRFRARAEESGDSATQTRRHRGFEFAWVGLSVALNLLFAIDPGIAGLARLGAMATAATDPLVVEVTARQWEWRFVYPQQGVTTTGELVLPLGRTARFVVTSEDVVHSFWVPALRLKTDAVPGQTRSLFLTPERIISTATDWQARVQCAELCGVGHALMRAEVRVLSPADFEAWIAGRRAMPQGGP